MVGTNPIEKPLERQVPSASLKEVIVV
jgi:hypothetical protein